MFEIMLGGGKPKGWVPSKDSMFIREVGSSEFITGDVLAAQIGLTAGVSQHSDAGWLLFADTVDGHTKYIAKRPFRHSITWDQLNVVGVVFGTRTVVINDLTYKVRLPSGVNFDPATESNGWDAPYTHGCEWNRLMYRISAKPFGNPKNTLASEGITEGDWASYSEKDLLTHFTHGYGNYSLCQETGTDPTTRVVRGYGGVGRSQQGPSKSNGNYGWRPVLELVE